MKWVSKVFSRIVGRRRHDPHPPSALPSTLEQNIGVNVLEWPERVALVEGLLSYLPLETYKTVGDFGCGQQYIRRLLPETVEYFPFDYIKRSDDTIVIDLNKDFPDAFFDLCACTGVVEYLDNPHQFLHLLAEHGSTILFSYHLFTSQERRDRNGWKNCLAEQEIIDIFASHRKGVLQSVLNEYNEIYMILQSDSEHVPNRAVKSKAL